MLSDAHKWATAVLLACILFPETLWADGGTEGAAEVGTALERLYGLAIKGGAFIVIAPCIWSAIRSAPQCPQVMGRPIRLTRAVALLSSAALGALLVGIWAEWSILFRGWYVGGYIIWLGGSLVLLLPLAVASGITFRRLCQRQLARETEISPAKVVAS
jgi:hypothetical protein